MRIGDTHVAQAQSGRSHPSAMEDDFPPAWPPPWRLLLAGAFWIASLDAVAQREWEIAGLALIASAVTAAWRHIGKPRDRTRPSASAPRPPVAGRRPGRFSRAPSPPVAQTVTPESRGAVTPP